MKPYLLCFFIVVNSTIGMDLSDQISKMSFKELEDFEATEIKSKGSINLWLQDLLSVRRKELWKELATKKAIESFSKQSK